MHLNETLRGRFFFFVLLGISHVSKVCSLARVACRILDPLRSPRCAHIHFSSGFTSRTPELEAGVLVSGFNPAVAGEAVPHVRVPARLRDKRWQRSQVPPVFLFPLPRETPQTTNANQPRVYGGSNADNG